ncbi:MAG: hypothetical protein R3Y56_11145 [Akkermansia sp.]
MKACLNTLGNILLALPISFLFNILLNRLKLTYWQALDWHPARCFMDVFYPDVTICGETAYDVQLFDDILVSNGIFMAVAIFIIILYAVVKAKTPHHQKE